MSDSDRDQRMAAGARELRAVEHAVARILAETERPVEVYEAPLEAVGRALDLGVLAVAIAIDDVGGADTAFLDLAPPIGGEPHEFCGRPPPARRPSTSRSRAAGSKLRSDAIEQGECTVIKLTVLYGPPTDPAAFEDYYANTHLALAAKIPNARRIEASKVLATPADGEAPYHRIAELWFDSADEMQAALGSADGRAAVDDIGAFATGGATVVVSALD